jgi:UDP:flavonoid glycosyltransferase YjiC (YdhE family)
MKKKALIIPAQIRSHVLPSFFIADILSKEYDVTYAVTDNILAEAVHENGFIAHIISRYKAGYGIEERFIRESGEKVSLWALIKSYFGNVLYWNRKKEIEDLLEKVNPDIVIVDIYNSTDFLFLHSYYKKLKIFFFNPMPSTYRVEGVPIVSENNWLTSNEKNIKKYSELIGFFKSPKEKFLQWVTERQFQHLLKLSKIPSEHGIVENNFFKAFNNVPELLLLPLEFELSPLVRKSYQYYLGLSQRENRIDTELDNTFEDGWQQILDKKQEGKRIIYCSFGTFFETASPQLLDFINRLLEVLQNITNTFLICSVNKYVVQAIHSRNKSYENAIFFSRVPQLKVLKISDLFITHGGLGGIKESIFYKVPMLVYPLDLHYDQSGNALKVEHHGIGLRGNFTYETIPYMTAKIKKLLRDSKYQNNLNAFNENIKELYNPEYYKNVLNEILA